MSQPETIYVALHSDASVACGYLRLDWRWLSPYGEDTIRQALGWLEKAYRGVPREEWGEERHQRRAEAQMPVWLSRVCLPDSITYEHEPLNRDGVYIVNFSEGTVCYLRGFGTSTTWELVAFADGAGHHPEEFDLAF